MLQSRMWFIMKLSLSMLHNIFWALTTFQKISKTTRIIPLNPTSPNSFQLSEAEVLSKSKAPFSLFAKGFSEVYRFLQTCFGGITMALLLSILAIFPVLNLISLGYLMKASGKVAESGRLRDGFIGFREASFFGGSSRKCLEFFKWCKLLLFHKNLTFHFCWGSLFSQN